MSTRYALTWSTWGTHGVLKGYSRCTPGVLKGYSSGTQAALAGYSSGTQAALAGVLKRHSRGTQGVLKGTQGYSRVLKGYSSGTQAALAGVLRARTETPPASRASSADPSASQRPPHTCGERTGLLLPRFSIPVQRYSDSPYRFIATPILNTGVLLLRLSTLAEQPLVSPLTSMLTSIPRTPYPLFRP